MVFSSLQFIGIFLPIFFIIYYLVPNHRKNMILLAGSLIFYFIGTLDSPEHFILFLVSIMLDFILGLAIEKYQKAKKFFLVVGVLFHFAALGYFKYATFVVGEINRLAGLDIVVNAVLPIGISFYTFQSVSYLVDVYRGNIEAEKSLRDYAVYISMYEQLIAGPIVTYHHVKDDLHKREIKAKTALNGIATFIFGLGLKVLLANPLGKLWSQLLAIGFESVTTPFAWMGIVAYSFQIYFDFFGYSLMAIGLGKMLGFTLPINFDFPYLSRSMTEFWRRWHITLGSWFREYVYIPLGGNRKGAFATIRNLFIVWVLTGVWHGAGYNFVLWGLMLFVILMVEKFIYGKWLDKLPVLGHIYMIFLIPLSWTVFAIEDIGQLVIFFKRLFPFLGQVEGAVFAGDYLKYLEIYWPFYIAGILFSTRLPFKLMERMKNRFVLAIIFAVILAASIYCMYMGFDDPFLYFRF